MLLAFGQNGGAIYFDPWLGGASYAQVPGAGPVARRDACMVHDTTLDRTLVFGGRACARGQTCAPFADLWQRSGASWSALATTGSAPLGALGHGMVYDDKLLVSVVFGGRTSIGLSAETFELDGTAWWQNNKSSQKPSPRSHAAMAFDPVRGVSVMFGGNSLPVEPEAATGHLDDTWEYAPVAITCTQPTDCFTGFCVDGVCCEKSSCGTCQSCATATQPGKCASIDGPDPDSCLGTCAGGACKKPSGGTCSTGSDCEGGQCNGGICCPTACPGPCGSCVSGSCQAAPAGTTCGAFVCNGTSTACPTSCSSDADCATGRTGKVATGECLGALGSGCAGAAECSSGCCADGVCCESACDGL